MGIHPLQIAWFPAAPSRNRAQRCRSIICGQPKRKQTSRAPVEPPIVAEVEPEIQMGMEPEEQRDMEVQAQPVQVFLREELAANLNPVPDMPTAEQFLAEWVNIVWVEKAPQSLSQLSPHSQSQLGSCNN